MRVLNHQDLLDLVNGAAIYSAGGGGAPEIGYEIVERLSSEQHKVRLVSSSELPDESRVVNFACVGATANVEYDPDAAVRTLRALEDYTGSPASAIIPVELGGFNTLAAVDVAARSGLPVVDGDGAGRSVPEVHLKVYTIDGIPLTPMAVADLHAKNIVLVKETMDSRGAERIARVLASEWHHTAYTARRILTATQVRSSSVQGSLSRSIDIGRLLRKSVDPVKDILAETGGIRLFEGVVEKIGKQTAEGFTFINVRVHGEHGYAGNLFELKAKNEVLVAYHDGKLAAVAPDIITPIHSENGRCITAERLSEGDRLTIIGIPTAEKWRTRKGLELWNDVLKRTDIHEIYVPIEQLLSK
ncbi:DUF917 family protein [Candidatus Bathyarchaeota archaeon]|nr:DUF917 family protein [Candidatus Bathyarchaeota archaeon]